MIRPALPIGDTFNGLTVERLIARPEYPHDATGTESNLYEARDATGTRAFLKVSRTAPHVAALARTVAIHDAVGPHPHLANLLAHGPGWGAWEYVDGAVATQVARAGQLEPADVILVGLDVLSALETLHRAGFVSGDPARTHQHVGHDGVTRLLHPRGDGNNLFVSVPLDLSGIDPAPGGYDHRRDLRVVALLLAELLVTVVETRSVADARARFPQPRGPKMILPDPVVDVLVRATEAELADGYQAASEMSAALATAAAESGLVPDRGRLGAASLATDPATPSLPSHGPWDAARALLARRRAAITADLAARSATREKGSA